jgi:inositol oxygenase
MEDKYYSLDHFTLSIWDCLLFLDQLVDDSDPDTQNSQLQHALQTAESARLLHPTLDWFHLVGLIHDLGKLLSTACHEPQWAVVGDTFPVGCAFSPASVFPDSFSLNPDSVHPVYSTQCGVYEPHCGLSQVKMSFGHDSYLAEVVERNHSTLPPEALAMIRYHSFYPWHKHSAYSHLTNQEDEAMKHWVLEFNKCDLYSKDAPLVDVDKVKSYYDGLIEKYFPATLKW